MDSELAIEIVDPGHPAALKLIAELDAYQAPMYPKESNHLDSLEELRKDNVRFLGAFLDLDMIACGAVKLMPGYGEIKRVYVPPHLRGKGIAKAMMNALEVATLKSGRYVCRLETGIYQDEALRLYESLGYARTRPFGGYVNDPMSVFMEKRLTPG